ncbi:HAUS augmin-like complex subunit 4 [Apteryx mantelli]|uniref:HAUS augmin-like complex subunit 4 n=1 Tax=Apteryx mantelli TaxID=2696672 RepID=A0ABM4G7W0_9AVES
MALDVGPLGAELPLPGGAPPGLGRLLWGLSDALGPGRGLRRRLEQAEAELRAQRGAWLRWDSVWRLLREAACDPPGDAFPAALERTLDLAELRRGPAPPPPPPAQDRAQLRARLLPELERRLRDEARELRGYHGGGAGSAPGGDVSGDVIADVTGDVSEALAGERQRLGAARARSRELAELLERQREAYPQALGRCAALLGLLGRARLPGAAEALSRRRAAYLEAKGAATLLKIRLEELTLLLDTYPPEKVEAHRLIRAALEGALGGRRRRRGAARAALGAFGALGPGFGALAQEYGRLRQRGRLRRWALRQLRPPGPGHAPGHAPGDDDNDGDHGDNL